MRRIWFYVIDAFMSVKVNNGNNGNNVWYYELEHPFLNYLPSLCTYLHENVGWSQYTLSPKVFPLSGWLWNENIS